ncbi:MAG: PAS domain S-box protein [Dehalococcoidales bacterium]|nr:PAS domain S-box protein [Dehalococcoidales bacterium]
MDQALIRAEQNFRNSLDNSPLGIRIVSGNGETLYANRALLEIYGYESVNELRAAPTKERYTTESYMGHKERQRKRKQGEFVPDGYVISIIRKNGEVRHLEVFRKEVLWNGEPQFQVLYHDITKHKELELEYQTILRTTIDGFSLVNMQGQLLDVNDAYCKLIGYSRDELLKMKITDIDAIEEPEATAAHIAEIRKVGLGRFETRHRCKDGRIVDVEVSANYTGVAGGRMIIFIRDVTERKRVEEALRESEEQYRSLVNLGGEVGEAVIMLQDTDQEEGVQVFASDEWLHITGYSRDELIGTSFFNLVHPDSRNGSLERHRRKMRGEIIPGLFEMLVIRKDGTEVPLELTSAYTTYRGEHANVIYARDITERKATEDQLRQSEEKYSTLVERANDGICIIQDRLVKFTNSRLAEMWGGIVGEIINTPFLNYIHPDNLPMVVDYYSRRMRGEQSPDIYETVLVRKDGSKVYAELSVGVIEYLGRPAELAIVRDITERKGMEKELEQERALFVSGPTVVFKWLATKGWPIDYASPNVYGLLGYSAEDLTDGKQLFRDMLYPDDVLRIIEENKRAEQRKGQRILIGEYRIVTRDSKIKWVHEHTVLVRDEEGAVKYHHGYVTDITEQKKAEVEKREMEKKAQITSRLASIGEMASGIAHEINNPLTSVVGFSELLMEKDLPKDLREDVETIHSGAERVAGIVKGLLTFARQHKPVRNRTGINEIIGSTLALRKYALETSNIEVITLLDNELPWTVADAGQLQQVFLNIIVNAEAEMKKAHGRGRLTIRTERAGDRIRISFADDGPGIAGENLERIFDPFFTTKEVGEGTGLGLSLAHGIIAEHNGALYAESEEGKGAAFFVELPIVAEEEKIERVKEVEAAGKAVGGRILVVDDEPAILAFLKKVLGGEGYDVTTAGSGREALEMIKEQGYDLIISDVKMPGLSGAELYDELGEIAPSLQKRVIFITGDVISTDTNEFLKGTRVPCVPKPFDITGLKKEVNRVIKGII